jgi:hypothetical protein
MDIGSYNHSALHLLVITELKLKAQMELSLPAISNLKSDIWNTSSLSNLHLWKFNLCSNDIQCTDIINTQII